MVIESLFIGLIVGFLFYELVGYSPGGVVAPGYLALFVGEPLRILTTVVLAVIVWSLLELLSARLIVYGRRRFLLALLLGFCGKFALDYWVQPAVGLTLDLQSIGYIIPGLIAHEMVRQRPFPTLASLGIVTSIVAMILMIR